MIRATNIFLFTGALTAASAAAAYPTEDDQSVGTMAINFRRQSNVWSRLDLGVVDAKVTSSPPDSTKYDRRLEGLYIFGGEGAIAKRWGIRVNAKAEVSHRREAEDEEPRAFVEKTMKTYTPSADVTFVTDKGLELFGGAVMQAQMAYTETVNSAAASSQTHFDKSLLTARRLGVVRRSGPWTGGFFYVLGAESDRGYQQTASDGSSLWASEKVFIPSRIGVFGEFGALSSVWDFELDFVQARGMGPKDQRGTTIYTDYFEARAGFAHAIVSGFGLRLAGAHKTLSYASNAYVSLETMPISSVRMLFTFGSRDAQTYLGIIGAYGKDGQSLPELNAAYQMTAFSGTAGFIFPL